ncbi:MAG: SNF2 helicase-associated domain-containing protein, partial [Actinomycetota bacterium]
PGDVDLLDDVEAVFVPADTPRHSALAQWRPNGDPPPGAEDLLELVVPANGAVRTMTVPVRLVPLADLLDRLLVIPNDALLTPSMLAWARAARIAVELAARGRLTPGITDAGFDTWRLGPLDPDDVRRRVDLAETLPPAAHCLPASAEGPPRLTSPRVTIDAFSDAVADLLPRTAAAARFAGHQAFADRDPQPVGQASSWFATTVTGGARTTITLRLIVPDPAALGRVAGDGSTGTERGADEEGEPELAPFEAELLLQSPDDPSLLVPAAELWQAPEAVMARLDDAEDVLLRTLRRAARVWPPIGRLLSEARPSRLELDDDEVDALLGPVVDDLANAGLFVQWPRELLRPLEVRPTISTPQVEKIAGSGLSLDVILGWQASVDGLDLTTQELEELAAAKRGVVQLRGQWVRADPASLRRLSESRDLSAGEAIGVALGGTLVSTAA